MRSLYAALVLVTTFAGVVSCSSSALEPATSPCLSGANCSGVCVQLATDGANCGACGVACAGGQVCSAGRCTLTCESPLATCGAGALARCTDLRSDPTSCGSCGRACAEGQLCAGGECVETCSAPLTTCNDGISSTCVDLRFDPSHCGDCETGCAAGNVCSAGECRPACSEPLSACGAGASGICADLRNDPIHCGACDIACPSGQVCSAGVCGPSCAAPLAVCGVGDDARCVDLRSDATSCGTCGRACDAGQACLAGACVATCEGAGGTLCDGTCVDVTSDNANCGSCDNACPAGTACQAAACAATCPAGQIPCGGSCLDASNDPENCGTCGNVCATGICRAGDCAAPACEGTIGLPGRPLAPPSVFVDQPWDHALADLDGDGVLDLAIPRGPGGVIEIRYVRAPGVFGPAVNIVVSGKPGGVAAGDVDGDGRVDLVACSYDGPGAISLLRNRGDGTFDRSDAATNGAVTHCALGDLDGDGRPDLVMSYPVDARIAVARNTGGVFAAPSQIPSAKPSPRNIVLADLDRDAKLDVVVLNAPFSTTASSPEIDRGSVSVYPGGGDGTLEPATTYASGELGLDVIVADLDADGWLDVATAGFHGEAVFILRNDGAGELLPRSSMPVGNRAISLAAGDLDGNGSIDLVVNRYYDDVAVLSNDGHAAFAVTETYAIRGLELALADANRDGALDLYNASSWPQLVPQEAGRLVAATPIPAGGDDRAVLVDLDRDSRVDAVIPTGFGGPVAILRGQADATFAPPAYLAGSGARHVTTGDIDGDGDIDLVYASNQIALRRNHGDGTFGPEEQIPRFGRFSPAPALGDLDGDRDLDLVVAFGLSSPGSVHVYWNDGGGTFHLGPELVTGWDSRTPVIGAVTGSGRPDVLVPNWMDGTISVFRGHADGRFTLHALLPVPLHSEHMVIADVTQDGRADLVVTGPGDPFAPAVLNIRIYPGLDHGLGSPLDLPAGVWPQDLAVADIDSDGRRDLVVVNGGHISVRRALPGGGFASPTVYATAAGDGVTIRDLNGDLRPDLIMVGDYMTTQINRCFADP